MRALTLIRPMAAAIVHGTKRIENRPRDLPKAMRGVPTVVAVHAGEKWSEEYAALIREIGDTLPGAGLGWTHKGIVGLMRLTGRVFMRPEPPDGMLSHHAHPCRLAPDGVDYTPWFSGPFGYEIDIAAAFPVPIACRGMQGWWPVPAGAIVAMGQQADAAGTTLYQLFAEYLAQETP